MGGDTGKQHLASAKLGRYYLKVVKIPVWESRLPSQINECALRQQMGVIDFTAMCLYSFLADQSQLEWLKSARKGYPSRVLTTYTVYLREQQLIDQLHKATLVTGKSFTMVMAYALTTAVAVAWPKVTKS